MLQTLLEAVRAHVKIELSLVLLESRRGRRVGEDVALDEVVTCRTLVQALAQIVCRTLALQLKSLGLECSVVRAVSWAGANVGNNAGKHC